MIGCMLDDLCRALGVDGPITVFTGDAIACKCFHSEAVLWVGLTLGTKTHLVSVESEDCTADATPNVLICRKPASPLGRLLVALPDAGSIAGAIVVCWGCPDLAMKDSSYKRSAHVPRGMGNQSPP
ncbi:hypothetical protein CDL15_Pgr027399 [Punica granatum]|uniref:Uncharacterized protein n=1 Tax=Punica granatum TaxID=22663 RepID=A0A218Y2Z1_PUNGR|nr:hypothetical protein CDL15_Pgr027399 [Punica granatum]